MCLTDATNLITYDPKDKKQQEALAALKKELEAGKRALQARIDDINRGLQKINENLSRST